MNSKCAALNTNKKSADMWTGKNWSLCPFFKSNPIDIKFVVLGFTISLAFIHSQGFPWHLNCALWPLIFHLLPNSSSCSSYFYPHEVPWPSTSKMLGKTLQWVMVVPKSNNNFLLKLKYKYLTLTTQAKPLCIQNKLPTWMFTHSMRYKRTFFQNKCHISVGRLNHVYLKSSHGSCRNLFWSSQ